MALSNVLWNVLFYIWIIQLASLSPCPKLVTFVSTKGKVTEFLLNVPKLIKLSFSVSGSNHTVTFIQIIIFQVHNNYQKELNYFELSQVTFYLNAGNHTSWYNSHKRQVGTIFKKDPHRCRLHETDELSLITPPW